MSAQAPFLNNPHVPITDAAALPLVLHRAELCGLLRICAKTLQRRLRAGVFPIPQIPDLPGCWYREEVLAHLNGARGTNCFAGARRHARQSRRPRSASVSQFDRGQQSNELYGEARR